MGFFRKKIVTSEDLHRDKKKRAKHDKETANRKPKEDEKRSRVTLRSVCDLCGEKGGLLNDKLESITVEGRDLILHPRCVLTMRLQIEQEQGIELEKNKRDLRLMEKQEKRLKEFRNISYNLDSGLEAILVFDYSFPTPSKTRLFFSKENNTAMFSRDYLANTTDNAIHLKIEPTTRRNAKLISGGNYDFNDSFDDGYSLVVNLKYGDPSLRKEIIDILREEGFGCLPADFTIHAHLNRIAPKESDAKNILSGIVKRVRERISFKN